MQALAVFFSRARRCQVLCPAFRTTVNLFYPARSALGIDTPKIPFRS
jgi:hypothetical protein